MGTVEKKKGQGRKEGGGDGRRPAGAYEGFIARLEERIPDGFLVDQLERELRVGGDAPDLKAMSIRQKARQDIEAHKGYRRTNSQEAADRKDNGGLIVRIVRFAEVEDGR
jgi:hypothetical protein